MWLRPARQPPDLHVVVSTNRRSRRATYAAVCSKRATLLGNADRANRKLRCGRNRPSGWTLSVQVFGPGGTRSEYRSRIFWIDGRRTRAAAEAPQRKRPCRSRAIARRCSFFVAFLWLYLSMPSSTGRARRAVLVTALCAGASLAHAQQLPSIESLSESCGVCAERLCAATR